MSQMHRSILAPIASLKLTVALLGMAIVLIFAGTLAQTEQDIWAVVQKYFRSALVYIPLRLFVPRETPVHAEVPFPGGYTIAALMLVNLVAAHASRFRVRAVGGRLALGLTILTIGIIAIAWFHNGPVPGLILAGSDGYGGVLPLMLVGGLFYAPAVIGCAITFERRGGIVMIHAALILLIVGEFVTGETAIETQMPIYEGTSSNWAHDIREVELSIVDTSSPNFDFTIAIPQSKLARAAQPGELIAVPDLPFDVRVERFYTNSRIQSAMMSGARTMQDQPRADRGFGLTTTALPAAEVSGLDPSNSINVPAAYVTFERGDQSFGTYLLSPHLQLDSHVVAEQELRVSGQAFRIALRFRRHYKPYSLHLIEFRHDLYPGTNVPRNFSGHLRLVDPQGGTDQDVVISMNNPLRHAGETFFQTSWIPGRTPGEPDRGTVLMVVRNPGWTIPYIACAVGTIGLIYHFGLTLARFLRRRTA